MGRKLTQEEFIEKARVTHGETYDYSNVKYINRNFKVYITCRKHGDFLQKADNHLVGQGCPLCKPMAPLSDDEVVNRINNSNPEFTVLKIIRNKSTNKRVEVIDKYGIIYNCFSDTLFYGGTPSIQSAVDKNKAFKIKSELVHGNEYDYSKVNYIKANTKVLIGCPVHGFFSMRPNDHLSGQRCGECGKISSAKKASDNPTGWGMNDWINASKRSPYFDGYKVYIIKAYNDTEVFIKIGRTFVDTKIRFSSNKKMPYNYEILKEIRDDNPYHIFKLEEKLKRICKDLKYQVKIPFSGMHECFTPDCLELLKDYINPNNENDNA